MPNLELAGTLDRPGIEDVRRIQAVMLRPDDESRRSYHLARWTVLDLEQEACARGLPKDQQISVPFELAVTLARSPSAAELEAEARDCTKKGMAVGDAFFAYFSTIMLRRATLENSAELFTSFAMEAAESAGGSLSWFNNKAWPSYKAVAHLWAAANVEHALGESKLSPCGPKTFRRFLALAQRLAEFGCQHVAPRQSAPFFAASDIWWPPSGLRDADYEAAVDAFDRYWQMAFARKNGSTPAV